MEENHKLRMLLNIPIFLFLSLLLLFNDFSPATAGHHKLVVTDGRHTGRLQTYVVHVEPPASSTVFSGPEDREKWYKSFLPVHLVDSGERRLLYSYHHVVSGFAARLTEDDLAAMRGMDGFLAAYPDRLVPLQTTHSADFLGLSRFASGFWNDSNFGRGVIIGVLDTGILPTHPSFSGRGIPPPPSKWKGRCDFRQPSECSNKLIGARTFTLGLEAMQGGDIEQAPPPPYDNDGHGTHTASTAAGVFVDGASAYGNAKGSASGMAPGAHLAIYKVCGGQGCPSADILMGLDTAVADGVDVVSLSLGAPSAPFYMSTTAVGTFGAAEKGVFVSCAAGNSGPFVNTMSNEAPWMLTVGAGTMDRSIRATVRLGNGLEFDGESLYQPSDSPRTLLPLVYAGACRSLAGVDVRGKVVLCDTGGGVGGVRKGSIVKTAGGAAMILANILSYGYTTMAEGHVLPASNVNFLDGSKIKDYIRGSNNSSPSTATIFFKGTVVGEPATAPAVAYFSSRGPSLASPGILKPDVIGPGVSILAAWPSQVGPPGGGTPSTFNIISGTSMATPHLSGVAALLKSTHPRWSPAAIKSAIMTTALIFNKFGPRITDQTGNTASYYATGSGMVNPSAANNPGLIYDLRPDDYVRYLCGLGYSDSQVRVITRRAIKCSDLKIIDEAQLNYPSLVVYLNPANNFTRTVTRTVTNVGAANSVYQVVVEAPRGVTVTVSPTELRFDQVDQKREFSVSFITGSRGVTESSVGILIWASNLISVMSPIVVSF